MDAAKNQRPARDWDAILAQAMADGTYCRQLARRLGVSAAAVWMAANKRGIALSLGKSGRRRKINSASCAPSCAAAA
jgi:transposase